MLPRQVSPRFSVCAKTHIFFFFFFIVIFISLYFVFYVWPSLLLSFLLWSSFFSYSIISIYISLKTYDKLIILQNMEEFSTVYI